MKQIVIFMLTAILGFGNLTAQNNAEPVMVREGRKWVYGVVGSAYDHSYKCVLRTVEFKGDTVIDGRKYKKCIQSYNDTLSYTNSILVKNLVLGYVREENKKVYCIYNYPYIVRFITGWYGGIPSRNYIGTGEFQIYDFNDPKSFIERIPNYSLVDCMFTSLPKDGKIRPLYFFYKATKNGSKLINSEEQDVYKIAKCGNKISKETWDKDTIWDEDYQDYINGIGFDRVYRPKSTFMDFHYEFPSVISPWGEITWADCALYCVTENDEIIYKANHYDYFNNRFFNSTSLKDVNTTNKGEKEDGNYYNLKGQVVENPGNGIYIHNGKKVLIK